MPSRSRRRTFLSRRRRLVLATGVALVAGALVIPAVNAATEATTATPSSKRLHDDFNGDGYPDVAIGAPGTAPDGETQVGAASVLYGSSSGLSTSRKQVLNWPGDEYNGRYGTRLQSADLDGDGYADLLSSVGWYMMDIGHGYALVVNWGGPKGLSATATTLTWAPQEEWQGASPSRTWTATSDPTW
ncbi:integrin alpha [Streptomyces sp. JCM17656]|nr:integrin alpha [Streptomyces sp. JCM17656]